MGAEVVATGEGYALGLIAGPGVAAGPFRADGLVAVGEVTLHNADELRARTGGPPAPDGELLLRAYARLGLAGIAAAEGMFALAVVEGADLVLVRDHVGARTLFHARAGHTWAASTSLRALAGWPALATGLHLPAVRSFLTFAYLPGAETLLRGVHEALPGRCLRLRPGRPAVEETYWEPAEVVDDRSPAEHAAALRALLEDATARRLPAAEPVGVLLSGGIDSSLVTAIAAKRHDQPVRTYSISFGDELPNELAYSGLVAAHCHTAHTVLRVSGEQVAARLPGTVALLDSTGRRPADRAEPAARGGRGRRRRPRRAQRRGRRPGVRRPEEPADADLRTAPRRARRARPGPRVPATPTASASPTCRSCSPTRCTPSWPAPRR